ncbi:hypothetical protein Pla22_39760 [Rubripirellula amarantea]|uniref:Uncharacterized protein n=2 Tax=Rubripirellula amarantea TaxID=2527999 RepID=A0A5C5WM31_9BACT|nr:hypothetical protein Pla22_39760 [Rubripirellula amarantea]
MEAVLAAALLFTAGIAVAKYAKDVRKLDRNADVTIAAKLACDNTVERLRTTPADQWMDTASDIAEQVSDAAGLPMTIDVSEFETNDSRGQHAEILARYHGDIVYRTHAWSLLEPTAETNDESSAESEDAL